MKYFILYSNVIYKKIDPWTVTVHSLRPCLDLSCPVRDARVASMQGDQIFGRCPVSFGSLTVWVVAARFLMKNQTAES